MKKDFFRTAKLLLASGLLPFLVACSGQPALIKQPAGPATFQEGVFYQKLDPPEPVATQDGRVDVVEVFFYACPHCNKLEPKIKDWLKDKQDKVNFRRVPAIMGPTWVDQAKAYYVAEKLGILETAHPALLKSIHNDGKQYYNEYSLLAFFLGQGVTEQAFIDAYNSPEVAEKVSQARVLTVRYGLRGVPAMIINGRYKTAQYFTGSQEKMLAVVDSLVAMEMNKALGH